MIDAKMAGGITESQIEEIKSRIDLSDLVSSYGISVREAGGSKKACCPFHNEKTPSFNIDDGKGFYHCFGCGESGDAIKFVEKMEGLSFIEAVRKLAGQAGVELDEREDPEARQRGRLYALLAEAAQFYRRCLLKIREGETARKYLESRELGGKIQEDYLIGYAPAGISNMLIWAERHGYTQQDMAAAGITKLPSGVGDRGYHRFGGRLMFPVKDKRGRVVGFSGRQLIASKNSGKYVNSPETAVFKKSRVLYGFDKAASAIAKARNREAIVCEGQIDCIRMQTSGFPNTVAGQGTAFTEEHVQMLKRVADQVVLVYDDDAAGHKATVKSARLCLAAELPVRVVSLPGGDDPDSFLRSHPAEEFAKMLDNAQSVMSFQVRSERAKERDPGSVDAVHRIVREVLLTIVCCPSAVLRATMLAEAAKLLGLPAAALSEELGKVKPPPKKAPVNEQDEEDSSDVAPEEESEGGSWENAGSFIAPPPAETAFCEFLLANEFSEEAKTIDEIIGGFLPEEVFSSQLSGDFVKAWREEIASGADAIVPWSSSLGNRDREWFDSVLLGRDKWLGSTQRPVEIVEDFVRALWKERLKRKRGDLPFSGDEAADLERMKISMDLKRLNSVKWATVKDIVRQWSKGG